ncbi:cytochrome P450 [Streptacidiphilus neutrinimicus]|uniref:cytochrome P450 n=1 Tax=Streptacidiphilus neutrinimicus TaxID=105420 RepID=UPI0005A7E3D0|nr:cytochrome P450 [Streptacidiphilus neutrinimicus]
MTTADMLFNPFAPGFADDPYPTYRRMREVDPVHRHPFGFWVLTAYDDIAALLRAGLSVDDRQVLDGQIREQMDRLDLGVINMSMVHRDPPDHTRLRSLVGKVFTSRSVAALEGEITRLLDAALDRIAEEGQADLVEALAFPLPFAVISQMLGMPPADHARIRELTGILALTLQVVTDPEEMRRISEAAREMTALARELIAWKRANPAEDLLTALIAAEHEGGRLSDDELVAQVVMLYIAGHETTVNLISNGTLALLRNPEQLALLRARPGLAANAVEEFLRYDSPVQQSKRITLTPHAVRDRTIPAGAFVFACLASANRDPDYWGPDADELRIDRPNARHHVSFGAGPHHCLGAALARLEGRLAIGTLVQRFPSLSLGGDVTWNGRINLRGPSTLPITVG